MRTTEPDYQTTAIQATDEWRECRPCHYSMLRLSEYEISDASDAPSLDGDLSEYQMWGWMAFLWGTVIRFVFGLFGLAYRKWKLARLKASVLPSYPGSLVCPKCLRVERRR